MFVKNGAPFMEKSVLLNTDPYAGIEVADFLKTAVEDEKKITEEKGEKYKDLLSIVKDGKDIVEGDDMEMEISWEPGKNISDYVVIHIVTIRLFPYFSISIIEIKL